MGYCLLGNKRQDGQWQDAQDSSPQPVEYSQYPHPIDGEHASREIPPGKKNEAVLVNGATLLINTTFRYPGARIWGFPHVFMGKTRRSESLPLERS